MKWPCRECIVRARCSQECREYKKFTNFMINVTSPLLLLLSSILTAAILIYLTVFNNYYVWAWIFLGGSWAAWILIQWEDDFILTFLSPAFLPGFFVMKLLARKYKRA